MNSNSIGDDYLDLLTQLLNYGVDFNNDEVRYHLNNIQQLKSLNIETKLEIVPNFSNTSQLADQLYLKEDPHND